MVFDKLRSLFGVAPPPAPTLPTAEELADGKSYSIDAALRDHFAPVMRRLGFKGSGRNFRRVSGELFQAVNVQGSRYGGMFAVNLGVHPIAVPLIWDGPVDVRKTKEIECSFRRRLSEGQGDHWWDYFNTRSSVTEAATAAAAMFEICGLPLFDRLAATDGPFWTMTPEQFDLRDRMLFEGFTMLDAQMIVILARLRKAQGRLEESRAFARFGLRPSVGGLPAPNWAGTDELVALAGDGN